MTNLTAPRFTDADAAREHLEALHWPNGPVCPHCGSTDAKRLPAQYGRPSKRQPEGAIRKGVIQCNGCRRQFTVTVNTVFSDSKVPLNKWLLAVHLLTASKKGISSHQLHRMLGVTYKTAWFMAHRIREAMSDTSDALLGGGGGIVEADETAVGRIPGKPVGPGVHHKMKVLSLIDRNTGRSRSFVIGSANATSLIPPIMGNVDRSAKLATDQASVYRFIGKQLADHRTVNHAKKEYVRGNVHVNTVEGYFSIFQRGMNGVYQHCGQQHLHRYLREFDFRYTHRSACGIEDDQRAEIALLGIAGKRLMYRQTAGATA